MSLTAIVLLLFSAAAHAGWNLAGKSTTPSVAFFFIASVAAAIFLSPLLVVYGHMLPLVSWQVWALVAATGVCHAVYFGGLAGAYHRGDMSLVYPMVRALPVVFVALASIALGRIEQIGMLGLTGMAVIACGCFMLPMHHLRDLRLSHYWNSWCLLALITALGTTGYTLVDDQAQRLLREQPATALAPMHATLVFLLLQSASTAIGLGVWTLLSRTARQQMAVMPRANIKMASATGVIIIITYGLALASMAFVTDVSYVAAFRQLSIPLGVLLGIVFLREPARLPRLIGVAVILTGLVLVTVG